MYTIKQAAARSGVPVALLRAWERRYGVVNPVRTPSGYRLYDDESITRLRAMRRLVDDGWSASTAAAHIRTADEQAIDGILGKPDTDGGAASAGPMDLEAPSLAAEFVEAAGALDEPAFEAVLDEMFARGSFEQVADRLIMPALVALGEGWERGVVDVAGEHAAASAVGRRLGMAFLAAGRPADRRNLVLIGLPPGGRHELGALAFATAARRAGIAVRYLGADVPVQDWLDAATHTDAVAAVIGAVVASDVDPAERVAAAVRAARPQMIVAFGGRAASRVRLADAERELRLPDDLAAAVEAIGTAIGASGAPAATAD